MGLDVKILHVDDVKSIRIYVQEILKIGGILDVKSLSSGTAAIEELEKNPQYDLAILDARMDPINGAEVLQYIRKKENLKRMPVLFFTAESVKEEVVTITKLGVQGYLLKPTTTSKLLSEIQYVLGRNLDFDFADKEPDVDEMMDDFVSEMEGFNEVAQKALDFIKRDMVGHRKIFRIFSDKMFMIRGTAQQLGLDHIVDITYLAEEIAVKAEVTDKRPQLRRVIGCLWDAMSTTKYLLEHREEATTEEQKILKGRMDDILRVLGGPQEAYSSSEIDNLLKKVDKTLKET